MKFNVTAQHSTSNSKENSHDVPNHYSRRKPATRSGRSRGIEGSSAGAWSSGNYAIVGTTLQIVGEDLCEALDVRSGQKVLDVAAGNGNVTLAAARRWCNVVSTDYVPSLLEHSRVRAAAESGGKIGLANWTPEGFIGQVFKILGSYLPPPAGVKSPALWGTRARITEMFGSAAASIKLEPCTFAFRYRSPEHFLEIFRNYYGPMLKAFEALDETGRQGLRNDLMALIGRMNRADDGTMVVPSEYLQIVMVKK